MRAQLVEEPIRAHDMREHVVGDDQIEGATKRDRETVVVDQVRALDAVQLFDDQALTLEDRHHGHRRSVVTAKSVRDGAGPRPDLEDARACDVEQAAQQLHV